MFQVPVDLFIPALSVFAVGFYGFFLFPFFQFPLPATLMMSSQQGIPIVYSLW